MGMKRHARGIALLNDDVNLPSSHVWNKILWTFAISLLFPSVYSFNFSVWEYFPGKIISPHCQNKAIGAKLVILTKRFMWPIEVNDLKNQLCYKPVCTYQREPNWNGRRILSHSHWSEILLRYSHHQLSLSVQFYYRSICQKNSAQQRCLRDQI